MPKATTGQIVEVPLVIGGEFTAGDPTTQPENTVRSLRNYVFRPNRVDARPPFVADNTSVAGTPNVTRFFRFENLTNFTTDTMMIESSAGNIHKKPSNGQGWSNIAPISALANVTHFLSDYANLGGSVYAMFTNQNNNGVPAARIKWNGTSVKFDNSTNDVLDAALYSRTVTAFIDRLFFGYVRATVTPKTQVSFGASVYDFTNGLWAKSNVTATNLTANGVTKCVLYPTNTTYGQSYLIAYTGSGPTLGLASFAATDTVRTATVRWDLQNQHESYRMPINLRIVLITDWQANHTYAKGDLVSDGNAFRHRCTVGGTSGGSAPSWTSTRNGTTSDNTVTWTNEGSRDLAAIDDVLPNATDETGKDATTIFVSAPIPAATNTLTVSPLLYFGNSTNATITLAPVVASVKDGLSDGAAGKANRGCQMTLSEFYYPFVNTETATSATIDIDDVMWSEINQPNRVIASSTFSLNEVAGHITAAAVAGGRLFFFKRRGMWQFARTSDVNVPILPERPASVDVGCIGPRCIDVFMDELFWIDEHEIYRMRVGEDPKPIAGPGMREEILAKGTNWVETTTAPTNVPYLVVDKANRDVWVFTQIGKVYVYNLDTETWGYLDSGASIGKTANTQIFFDTVGQRMIGSCSASAAVLVRMDETSTSADEALSITKDIIFRPLETFSPDRFELSVQGVNLFHNATAWPAGATLTLQYSLNRGSTWTTPSGYPITTVDVSDPLIPLGIVQGGHSIMLRILVTGDGGAANWSISKASVKVRVESGEFYYTTAS